MLQGTEPRKKKETRQEDNFYKCMFCFFCFLSFFSPQKIQEGQTVPYFQIWSSTAEGYMSAHPWTEENISMGIKYFAGWEPQSNFIFKFMFSYWTVQ